MINDLPKVGIKSSNNNIRLKTQQQKQPFELHDKDNKRMEYVINFFKGMFFVNNNKMNSDNSKNSSTTNKSNLSNPKSLSILFQKDKSIATAVTQSQNQSERDVIVCHGWWEVVCLHKIPNDLQFVSASCSIYESDDLFSAFERLKLVIKDMDQDNWIDEINHKNCWFREIPDGITTKSLRHYLLTPGMRFLIISQSSEDIETFVDLSAFRHWIHGMAPFARQFQWPLVFTRLVNREHFPSYICDNEEALKVLKGEDRSNSLSNSDDETEHYHLKPSVFSTVSLLLHPHELINDEDDSFSNNYDESDESVGSTLFQTNDRDLPLHKVSPFFDNQK